MTVKLELKNAIKKFGGLTAVNDFSMQVKDKQIQALIGPNGAGKTTVFNLITSVYKLTSGQIFLDGKEITGMDSDRTVRAGICRTFQNIRLFKKMRAIDNVMTGMHCRTHNDILSIVFQPGKTAKEEAAVRQKCEYYMEFLGIADLKDEMACNLPYGHQRLLEIARALASEPTLLLLDEPAAGMNAEEKESLIETIFKIRNTFNLSILLVEHDMKLIMGISDSISVLNYGAKIAEGTPEMCIRDRYGYMGIVTI